MGLALSRRAWVSAIVLVGLLAVLYVVLSGERGGRDSVLPHAEGPAPEEKDHRDTPTQTLSISPREGRVEVFEEETSLRYIFTIENHGKQPVTIRQVVTGCSCNTTHLSAENIPPGGSVKLGVVYNAAALHGELPRRQIQIHTDASPEPLTCTVGGNRKKRFMVTPATVQFGNVLRGSTPTQNVTLESLHPDFTFVPEKTIIDSPWISGKVERVYRNQAGNPAITLSLQLHKDTPLGRLNATVFVPRTANDGLGPSAPISAEIIGPVSAMPTNCFFGVVAPTGQHSRTIVLGPSIKGESKPWSLVKCEVSPPHPAIVVGKAISDPYGVTITLDSSKVPPGSFEHKVRLVVNYDGAEHSLEVPVQCFVSR